MESDEYLECRPTAVRKRRVEQAGRDYHGTKSRECSNLATAPEVPRLARRQGSRNCPSRER